VATATGEVATAAAAGREDSIPGQDAVVVRDDTDVDDNDVLLEEWIMLLLCKGLDTAANVLLLS
jgi:hypothetical protein